MRVVRMAFENAPLASTLLVQQVPGGPPLPAYQTAGAAGLDLRARCFVEAGRGDEGVATYVLAPGRRVLALTGLRVAIPSGFVGLVCPRSGLALHHGVTLLNAPGVIDADYRGEIGVILVNHGQQPFACAVGERVAQLVVVPVAVASLQSVEALPGSERGEGGFGSTGR